MKKLLICSTAFGLLAAAPVQAQSYSSANNAKDHDTTLGSANYVQPQKQAAATSEEAPTNVEPAAGYKEKNRNFDGFYIGADGGYDWGQTHSSDVGGSLGSADVRGWGGGAFAGYGTTLGSGGLLGGMMSGMYLGGELGYDWLGAHGDTSGSSYRERRDFRATIRPGVFFDNVLGYGLAGYTRGDFRTDAGGGDNSEIGGYVVGLGVEGHTGTPLKARLEYSYSGFHSADLGTVRVKPHDNEVRVGLLYQFQ
jgi:outer membrane immunogenic protein